MITTYPFHFTIKSSSHRPAAPTHIAMTARRLKHDPRVFSFDSFGFFRCACAFRRACRLAVPTAVRRMRAGWREGATTTSATIVSAAPTAHAAARGDDDGAGEGGFDATARPSDRRIAWPLPLSSVLAPLSRALARSPASAQRPRARRCSGRSHQANFCRVRCVLLVGSFEFIARSPHAIECPPLLVSFDRIPGVSRALFLSCSGGVSSLGDSPSSARFWEEALFIVPVACFSFAIIVRSPHAAKRPPLSHFRSHFRCLGCSYVILWRVAV